MRGSPHRNCSRTARLRKEAHGPRDQGNAAGREIAIGLAYPEGVPPTLRLILASLLVLAGALFVVAAVSGTRSRLRRNRWIGVRTPATLASDAAFTIANAAAAAPVGAAGTVAVVGGAVLVGGADGVLGWVVLAISLLGTVVLAGVGGMVGDRAAGAVVPPSPFSAACAGTCAGCDLVAGCRPLAPAPAKAE